MESMQSDLQQINAYNVLNVYWVSITHAAY